MTIVDDHCDNCSSSIIFVTSLMVILFNFKILLTNMAYGAKDAPIYLNTKFSAIVDALKMKILTACLNRCIILP